jgi:hypothetical protein
MIADPTAISIPAVKAASFPKFLDSSRTIIFLFSLAFSFRKTRLLSVLPSSINIISKSYSVSS